MVPLSTASIGQCVNAATYSALSYTVHTIHMYLHAYIFVTVVFSHVQLCCRTQRFRVRWGPNWCSVRNTTTCFISAIVSACFLARSEYKGVVRTWAVSVVVGRERIFIVRVLFRPYGPPQSDSSYYHYSHYDYCRIPSPTTLCPLQKKNVPPTPSR